MQMLCPSPASGRPRSSPAFVVAPYLRRPLPSSSLPAPSGLLRPPVPFRTLAMRKRNPKRLKYAAEKQFRRDGEKMLYLEVESSGDNLWKLQQVVDLIKLGAVGVIPTDTVYAIVCDSRNHSSIERLRRIKGISKIKPLSILCHSLRDIDIYTTGFPRGNDHGLPNIFKAAKHCVPGPYTFILPARKTLPKQCIRHGTTVKFETRKIVGIRVPDDAICQFILGKLDAPLISTSVKWPTEDQWMLDPNQIAEIYEPEGIDFLVDGGARMADPSTIVDMTLSIPTIIRQGKGPRYNWMEVKSEEVATDSSTPALHANAAKY